MKHDVLNGLRKQLFLNGYHPIPNNGKIPVAKGWNRPDFIDREMTPDRIDTWPERFNAPSTGILICDGLCVVDIDVDDPLMEDLSVEIERIAPNLVAAPMRFGGGKWKAALFCRTEDDFVRIASRKYNGHAVEIFGGARLKNGNCSRQFGVYGPHSEGVEYAWAKEVPDLLKAAAADLPLLSKAQALEICGAFEILAVAKGWKAEAHPAAEQARQIYDIDENSRFDTNKGDHGVDYTALCDLQAMYGNLRCSSSFMGGEGNRRDRCWVFWSKRHECVAVFAYGDEATHYPKEKARSADPILEQLKKSDKKDRVMSARPDDDAPLIEKSQWLLDRYGYCALNDTIVELYKPADDCQLKPLAFQRLYRAWREETEPGPRGAKKFAAATGYWEVSPSRPDLEGVRMRPDRPFPVYEEHGRVFKNTYRRPQHGIDRGDIGPWLLFMRHLVPDDTEREWFCNWLAHKHVNPGVPGVAVIMVAATDDGPIYGAGRGILRDILARLLGPKYVKPLDFDIFTGQSSQGVYTDWAAYSVLITVSESKDTTDSGKWASRRAVYERLKEIVDPRAVERTFSVKGRPAFTAMSFASYLIFSNHRDAVQIAPNDRRVAALANGEQMSAKMAARLGHWMEIPANIAELARWLEARDLAGFSVYQPLVTTTKTTMQELAGTEFDEAFAQVRKAIGPRGLFTSPQLEGYMLTELNDSSEMAKRQVKRMVKQASKKVGEFRMPPAEGRHWILCWRDHNPSYVTDTVTAQRGVLSSRETLSRGHEDRRGQVLDFIRPQ